MVLGAMGDYLRNQHAMGRHRKIFACYFMKRRLPRCVAHRWRNWGSGSAYYQMGLRRKKPSRACDVRYGLTSLLASHTSTFECQAEMHRDQAQIRKMDDYGTCEWRLGATDLANLVEETTRRFYFLAQCLQIICDATTGVVQRLRKSRLPSCASRVYAAVASSTTTL
jgi:hypothetical protein